MPPAVRLVVAEGNYLLVSDGPWGRLRDLLDEVWFLDLDRDERLRRLTDRHVRYGRDRATAATRARVPDEANARLIAGTAHRADLVFQLIDRTAP